MPDTPSASQSTPALEIVVAAPAQTQPGAEPASNSAVARCQSAYRHAYQTERARGKSEFLATCSAEEAYRAIMPPLLGQDNIRDFIACIADALLSKVVRAEESSKLLYAAQVALGALRAQAKTDKTKAA